MSKHVKEELASFGKRLAALRKAAGYTQQQLADEIGVTRRMIAYYEAESQHPPSNLLTDIARALNITLEELLGQPSAAKKGRMPDSRLLRRLQQLEKLGPREKRQVLQLLDAFIERAQLKQSL